MKTAMPLRWLVLTYYLCALQLAALYHLYVHAISGNLKYEKDVSCILSVCIGYKP